MSKKSLFGLIILGLGLIVLVFVAFQKNRNLNTEKVAPPVASSSEVIVEATSSPLNASTTNFKGTLTTMPGSPDAPQQVKVETAEIPVGSVRLEVSDRGFSPKEFTVLAGKPVSLALTAVGVNTHVFIFPDSSLMGLTMMISGGDTKVLNFTAPAAGVYGFRDDIPTFRLNTGTMIVE